LTGSPVVGSTSRYSPAGGSISCQLPFLRGSGSYSCPVPGSHHTRWLSFLLALARASHLRFAASGGGFTGIGASSSPAGLYSADADITPRESAETEAARAARGQLRAQVEGDAPGASDPAATRAA